MTGFGPSDTVESVRFEGNRFFRSGTLLSRITTRPKLALDERGLEKDARVLEKMYQDFGFFGVDVEPGTRPGKRRTVAVFSVSEGERALVDRVVVTGNREFSGGRLLELLAVKPGTGFEHGLLSQSADEVGRLYLNSGFPFVEVTGEWETSDTAVVLRLEVEEGPRCRISGIRVRGLETVREKTVLRACELDKGEMFSQERLNDARRRLYATRLFQKVSFRVYQPGAESLPGLDVQSASGPGSVVVRFDVIEQPHQMFLFGTGLEGAGFELSAWRGLLSVGWQHDNVLNRGHHLGANVAYSPSFRGDHRIEVDGKYRLPYLIFTRVDFETRPFFYWERDSTLTSEYGAESELSRALTPEFKVGLGNRLRRVNRQSRSVTNSVALNLQYDTRDDFFDPKRGVYLRPVAEVAGGLLRGANDFYRFTGEARWFQSLLYGLVLAARAQYGRAIPYGGTEKVPHYEVFTLGGRNSLRGYGDRSLGPDSVDGENYGPVMLNTNVELRTPYILGWVGLVGFLDGGEVVRTESELTVDNYQYSAGAGIRVRTPIGPARLDWGKRLKDPVEADWGKWYLGLLHAF
ncbi:MAG: BamA/TamA family outer membrane protein [candidate division WOR-3 bacterium]|nr:MAG: BamA/TamA family outer membrane protein [candidate division WOR-3 bacterium]